jgi:hypothetical protein
VWRCGPTSTACGRHERAAAIVSQSGNVAVNLTFQQRGLRLGQMITVGNQASLGTEDAIEALLDDDRASPRSACSSKRCKRSAALRRGGGPGAAKRCADRGAADRPLGRRRGDRRRRTRARWQAVLPPTTRCSNGTRVATVRTPSELLEALKLLDAGGRCTGRRVVSLSCSGGEASLVADRSESTGLAFEPFEPDHVARIEQTLTELVSVSNPFDYHTFMWGDRAAMAATFTAVMERPAGRHDAGARRAAAAPTTTRRRGTSPPTRSPTPPTPPAVAPWWSPRWPSASTSRSASTSPAEGSCPCSGSEALIALDAAAHVGGSVLAPHAPVSAPGATRLVDEAAAKRRLRELGVAGARGRDRAARPGARIAPRRSATRSRSRRSAWRTRARPAR